jgi:enoyl-CoA hydratase
LAQLVGKGKANEMIFTAGMIPAADALTWGLVNAVCTQEELISVVEKIATKIAANSPLAIASAIRAVNASTKTDVNGFATEIEEFGNCFGTKDFVEGTTAFLEKRKPTFTV